MYRIKRRALPDVRDAPLQDDNAVQLPLAQMTNRDGDCWDGLCYGISTSSLMNRTMDTLCFLQEFYCRGPWQGFHFFTKSSPPKLGHPNMRRQLRRHHHHKPGSSQNNCRCGNYASTAHKDSIHEDSGDKPGGLTKYLGLRILNASNPNISKN